MEMVVCIADVFAWHGRGGDYMYVCIIPQNIGLNDANPKLSIRKELIISHVVYCHMADY